MASESDISLLTDAGDAVSNVSTLTKLISEHGALIVICAVFILAFILILLLFMKINNTMFKNVMKQMDENNVQQSQMTEKMLKHILDNDKQEDEPTKKNRKDLVGAFVSYRANFKAETKKVINKLRCDRASIYIFHNGNHSSYGFPFIKMTCIHEENIFGTQSFRGNAHVNLPLHLFTDLIESIYKDNEFAANSTDIELYGDSLKEFIAHSDTKALFIEGIRDEDDILAGFSVCEFDDPVDFSNEAVYKNIRTTMRNMNNSIKYIITNESVRDGFVDDAKNNQ